MTIFDRIRLAVHMLIGVPVIGEGETTSPHVAEIASRGLRKPFALTAAEIRALAASALAQAPNRGKGA